MFPRFVIFVEGFVQFLANEKRPVAAPTSEPLCKIKPLSARCTIFHTIFFMEKTLRSAPERFLDYMDSIMMTRITSPPGSGTRPQPS